MNIFITGASRGLGLEFVKQYLDLGHKVFATCRNPDMATDLRNIKSSNLIIYKMDVTNSDQIKEVSDEMHDTPIDILINNAGEYGVRGERFPNLNKENMVNLYKINAIAPVEVCENFVNNVALSKSKKIVTISALSGSISDNKSGGRYAYRASKAALNMLMRSLSIELQHHNIKTMLLYPGWVKTDMGTERAHINAQESVFGMINVIFNSEKHEDILPFLSWKGEKLPW